MQSVQEDGESSWPLARSTESTAVVRPESVPEPAPLPAVSDVLVAAILMVVHQGHPDLLQARLQSVRPIASLQLDGALCQTLLTESALEISALREALA